MSGEIFTARDAAHKKLYDCYQKTGILPFELQDKIVFYAGEIIPMKGHCEMYNSLLIKMYHFQMHVFIGICTCA